jgi:uncharacterized protein YaiL (DUF2058 family)
VKAGLATASQARKAERQVQAKDSAGRKGRKSPEAGKNSQAPQRGSAGSGSSDLNSPESVKARARRQMAEKKARDKALAQQTNKKAAARALRAEIKQIILNNDQRAKKVKDDDLPYNFVHGKKIKKIHVPREQLDKLSSGSLVIVNNDGLYHLVSREVAEQIRARDPKRIITAHEDRTPEPGSDDEYYARFQVPDDLDW